jgi:cytochrome c oxidase cbb3-type subunit 3
MSEHKKVHVVGDGILEEDNHLPNWWLATFFGAIIFSFFYWQYYHVLEAGAHPGQEYAAFKKDQMERLAAQKGLEQPATNAALTAMSTGPEAVAAGGQLFATNCLACHGAQGEGKIGPNLTDGYWIHGDEPAQIRASVAAGYPLKGMPAWEAPLGADKVNQLVAFVLTLKGKNLPGKPPENVAPGTQGAAPATGTNPSGVAANAP